MTAWAALFNVKAREADEAKAAADSADGVVIYHGRDDEDIPAVDEPDEPDEDDDGDTRGADERA